MDAQKRILPNETFELCFALLDAGYQSDVVTDPKAWNDSLTQEQLVKGYLWHEHSEYGWFPDPGREALIEEIVKLVGEEKFMAQYGSIEAAEKTLSHEQWMREWLHQKQNQA